LLRHTLPQGRWQRCLQGAAAVVVPMLVLQQ
jgi:hypothetical protein